jgi:hypothetical protein
MTSLAARSTTIKNSGTVAAHLRRLGGQSLFWVGQKAGISESRLCRYEQGLIELSPEKQAEVERVLLIAVRKRAAEIARLLASEQVDKREKIRDEAVAV